MPTKLPLEEPEIKSLEELYSADSENLTNDDLDTLVADLIAKRAIWLAADAEAKRTGKRQKKTYLPKPEKGQLSLEDLGNIKVSF